MQNLFCVVFLLCFQQAFGQKTIQKVGSVEIHTAQDAQITGLNTGNQHSEIIYVSSGTVITSSDQIQNAKIVSIKAPRNPSNYSKKQVVSKIKKDFIQKPKLNLVQPKADVSYENPISSLLFSHFNHLVSEAFIVLSLHLTFLSTQAYQNVILLFFFLCLFIGHKKFHIKSVYLKSFRVRPPPYFL